MRVIVTGAGGFIGGQLVKVLLSEPALSRDDGRLEQIGELILTSRSGGSLEPFADDGRVRIAVGDMADPAFCRKLFEKRVDSVFHLAATLTSEAEMDFRRGLDVNILGMIHLLETCRAQEGRVRFVFPSSIAAFGGPLPEAVTDCVPRTPQTSYGAAKAIAELLIDDYSRHGFIDGRALRLPVVIIRPKPSLLSVADRIGAVLRETLRGNDVICPIAAQTRVPIASVRMAAQALARLHEVPADRFGHTRAMNMPCLSASLEELAKAAMAFDHPGERGRVIWEKDDDIQAIVESWPRTIVAEEALRLGLRADGGVADIIRSYIEDFGVSAPSA